MRVPTYDDLQAAPQQLPQVQQQTPFHMMQMADIGPEEQERFGQTMEGMGNELSHETIARQIGDNESAAKNADTAAITGFQALLYGTSQNPGSGFLAKQGSEAVEGLEDFQGKLAETRTQILSGLQNDAQRRLAGYAIAMRYQDALERAARHAGQQRVVRDAADSQMREGAAADAAQKAFDPTIDGADPAYHYNIGSASPADKSPYQAYLQTVMVERQQQADLAGLTDDAARAGFIREGLEKAYTGIAMNYIASGQPVAAQNFLDAVTANSPDAISAAAMTSLRPDLVGAMQQHAVLGARLLLQNANPGDLDAQLQNLRGMHDSGSVDDAQFEQIQGGLKIASAYAEQQKNAQIAGTMAQAQDYLVKHPGSSAADLPPAIYNALKAGGQLAAMDDFVLKKMAGE